MRRLYGRVVSQVPDLRAQLRTAAEIDEPAGRALEVVAIIDEAIGTGGPHPVIVGGMAVYVWTENDEFLTVDIDVVVPTSPSFVDALTDLGFRRASNQRHWELPGTDVLIEAPAGQLDVGAIVESVETPSGRVVGVLSHGDVLLDRIAEFQATGHELVAQQVLVLLATLPGADLDALGVRARELRVAGTLAGMVALNEDVAAGRRAAPDSGEWHELARHFERSEYGQGPQ